MMRVQSSKIPSIHTVTPSICFINSSLENKLLDGKQDKGSSYFCTRAKQIMKEKIQFDPIQLTGTFFNPKTRRMKHLSTRQRDECIVYVKQEMLLFDIDDCVTPRTPQKTS
ncbi:unnamed protein product [Didymodactylos carnosus]|uniref:Uncharacterized protein n=1 Tax=Didymodactylos carnosus TaxID=1234261 RepID=A0A815JGY8_9BILA|nr:unnamed protein product [Didymodactylos carnosus]CAF1445076.1 unnamed protein product [Didymodactylos carnosus]CAF4240602.1 unnamed protein product [Didymodactylos carnosus]CAF4277288.1 unnamed protein product [Didymodactylos carnosus]